MLSHGRIEQIGTPDEIYERPASVFVAEFIGSSNLLPVRIVERGGDATLVVTEGGLRLLCSPAGDAALDGAADIVALVRPERVHVEATGGATVPRENRIAARVADVTYLGEDLHIGLELPGGDRLRAAMKNANAARSLAAGQSVEIVIAAADLRLLQR